MTKLSINRLTLSHFRSHKRTEIACEASAIAIVGANGAGKTNILEAVFSNVTGARHSPRICRRHDAPPRAVGMETDS